MEDSQPAAEPKPRNWFARNWLWFVPTGCFGCLSMFVGFLALIVYFVFTALRSSEPYIESLQAASEHPVVQERIGQPIEGDFFVSGTVQLQNSDGTADLEIPISGPKGSARIYVEAEKVSGEWIYTERFIIIEETGDRIDILDTD